VDDEPAVKEGKLLSFGISNSEFDENVVIDSIHAGLIDVVETVPFGAVVPDTATGGLSASFVGRGTTFANYLPLDHSLKQILWDLDHSGAGLTPRVWLLLEGPSRFSPSCGSIPTNASLVKWAKRIHRELWAYAEALYDGRPSVTVAYEVPNFDYFCLLC
jgi:hypothetical protein